MEIKLSELKGSVIFCQNKSCGHLLNLYIEEDSAKISGIENGEGDFYPTKDILQFEKKKIILGSKNGQKIIGQNWLKLKVKSSKDRYLGRVDDLWLSQNEFRVLKFAVSKNFFWLFKYAKRIFHVERIIEVINKQIIVNDDSEKKLDLPLVENVSFLQP